MYNTINMNRISSHILRTGLGITFLWIGIMIWQHPEAWAGYIRPWAANLIPLPIIQTMRGTAILDIVIGAMLLVSWWSWLAALVGALHLITVLIVSGITDITVRDIGLLAGSIALFIDSLSKNKLD